MEKNTPSFNVKFLDPITQSPVSWIFSENRKIVHLGEKILTKETTLKILKAKEKKHSLQ